MFGDTRGRKETGNTFGPVSQVISGIADDNGFSCRSRSGMNAHNVPQGNREHIIGITLLQVLAGSEGDIPQRLYTLELFEIDVMRIEGRLIKNNISIDPVECGLQPLDLKLFQTIPRDSLTLGIVENSLAHNFLTH
jgi:hypothetical protein